MFRIDPERIALVGHSAGGYLALLGGARLRPPPQALVSFYGYGDLSGKWLTKPDPFYNQRETVTEQQAFEAIGDPAVACDPSATTLDRRFQFYVFSRQQGVWPEEVTGHDPKDESQWFTAFEPIGLVTPAYPPTMLLHGKADKDVPFEQSARMAKALARNSVPHELVTNPSWDHVFDDVAPEDPAVRGAFEKVTSFLNANVNR